MDESLRPVVHGRASGACEYCQMLEAYDILPFQIDHIRSQKHGGESVSENLALSCCNCNAHKGPNIAGHDPETDKITRLYHPRDDDWYEHFAWRGAELFGLTAIGRTTVAVLSINDADRVDVRRELITSDS